MYGYPRFNPRAGERKRRGARKKFKEKGRKEKRGVKGRQEGRKEVLGLRGFSCLTNQCFVDPFTMTYLKIPSQTQNQRKFCFQCALASSFAGWAK